VYNDDMLDDMEAAEQRRATPPVAAKPKSAAIKNAPEEQEEVASIPRVELPSGVISDFREGLIVDPSRYEKPPAPADGGKDVPARSRLRTLVQVRNPTC